MPIVNENIYPQDILFLTVRAGVNKLVFPLCVSLSGYHPEKLRPGKRKVGN